MYSQMTAASDWPRLFCTLGDSLELEEKIKPIETILRLKVRV